MQKIMAALLLAAALSACRPAQAALIMGSEAFSLTGVTNNYVPAGANLLNITSFNSFTLKTSSGNWTNALVSDPLGNTHSLGVSALDIGTLNTFAFGDSVFGTFQANAAQQASSSLFGQLSRTFFFLGTFTPGTAFVDMSSQPFMSSPASFTLTFNQSGGATSEISGSATLNAPPNVTNFATPEPTTMAMFGSMCVPLALGWYRRRSSVVSI